MWLTQTAIRRPIFLIMFIVALLVVGLISRSKMPSEQMPKVDFPYISIVTAYPGAGPNEIETLISEPLEKAVSSIGRIKNVTSTSQDGVSVVSIEFELGTDINNAAADVRDKVSAAKTNLPKDIDEPSIIKADISGSPVITIGLEGNLPSKEMRILADDTISDRLAKVDGAASVSVRGGDEREITIAVDKDRLQAYGVGIDYIVQSIQAANLNVPAGSIKEGNRDYSVRTVGEFQTAEEINNLKIFIAGKNGNPDTTVRLRDIASVKDSIKEPDVLARLNGKPTVIVSVQKQSDANTVDVCEGVKKELENLKDKLPEGTKIVIADDQSVFVEESLRDVNKSLMEGIFLVVVIVFLFLHSARATFIVGIAIPTSMFATYGPIHGFGFTLNFMTLLALSLVVGILVDDSIVILENIERHMRLREKPKDAALKGRTEIGSAAVAITMVDVVVFVPIAFMGGIVGQFFRQFGLTVAVATLFSLLMSFTLTPMLASRWLKSQDDKDKEERELRQHEAAGTLSRIDSINLGAARLFAAIERFLKFIDKIYHGILEWALDNRLIIIIIGTVSLITVIATALPGAILGLAFGQPFVPQAIVPRIVVSVLIFVLCLIGFLRNPGKKVITIFSMICIAISMLIGFPVGVEFSPAVDNGNFTIQIRTAPGTSLAATDKVVRQVENLIEQVPEMKKTALEKYQPSLFNPGSWFKKQKTVEEGYYITSVGVSSSGSFGAGEQGPQYALITGKVVDKTMRKRTIEEITDWLNTRLADIPGAEQFNMSAGDNEGPSGGLEFEVQGQNMPDILAMAEKVAGFMRETPGAVNVDISWKPGKPERRIIVDKIRAADYGMSVAEIASASRIAIDGNDDAKLREGGTEYPIMVRYALKDRTQASDVENLMIGHKDGSPIYLRDVADVRYDFAPTKIDRKNRQRSVKVTANIAKGAKLGNVQQEIKNKIAGMNKIVGTSIDVSGSGQIMEESFGYMGSALLLAILFVYMLMAALFESFLTPFVIMFSLPQAMAGALLALFITGKSVSIVSLIGIIMLMGLVAKNAILLVDYTNTLRSRGKSRRDAILQAGPTRLRPILMTTMAMVGGMLPTALATSRGAETRAPMAIDVIGGLIFSLLLTLVVIPVVYTIVDDMWMGFIRKYWPSAYRRHLDEEKEREMKRIEEETVTSPYSEN